MRGWPLIGFWRGGGREAGEPGGGIKEGMPPVGGMEHWVSGINKESWNTKEVKLNLKKRCYVSKLQRK